MTEIEFLLDPDVVFLNHGSFGACPRPLFEEYQRVQRRLEAQPVRFLQRELPDLLSESRSALAGFIGAEAEDVVFVTNPTFSANELARCLELGPGDEVLVSDQEYGACHNAWRFMAGKAGFSLVEASIDVPARSEAEIVAQFWSGVTDKTKVVFLSHITSSTALTIPVAEICARARQADILTVIDGAHVAGQMPLDVAEVGADFYLGTCHKWMCAPKGSAFMHAREDVQHLVEPLVVGWGWGDDRTVLVGSDFLDFHQWLGTDDPSAYVTVASTVEFLRRNDWHDVQARCHDLAVRAADRLGGLDGVERVHPDDLFGQMALVEIVGSGASVSDGADLQRRLYENHRVEVPVVSWNGRMFVRVSIAAYNSSADVDALESALAAELGG